ncbi:MAG: PqqD family protein [Gemmatimonadales bacterium]
MGTLTGATIVRRNARVVGRELHEGEGALLLHTETGAYHRLNRTGASIWRMLEEPARLEDLGRRLRGDLNAPAAALTEDLAAYVADLAGRDLVHLEPPAVR